MTPEQLAMKKWLNRAYYADKKIKSLNILSQQCRERAEGLSKLGNTSNGIKSPSGKNNAEHSIQKLLDISDKCSEETKKLAVIIDEILDAIKLLDNVSLEVVMINRYVLFHTIEQTAEELGYCPRQVTRKINQAIRLLCEKMSLNVLECPTDK